MPSANKTRPKALDGWGMVSTLSPPPVSTHGLTEVAPKRPLRAVASHPHRKVLILEDEPSIRNVLCVLLSGVGCEGDVALTDRQALELVSRESFDAVLLDLRSCSYSPEKLVADMERIRPSLVGRVLVITGEVADPQTSIWSNGYACPMCRAAVWSMKSGASCGGPSAWAAGCVP